MSSVGAAWAVEAGIVGVRSFTRERRAPLPSELLSTFIVFGGLTLLSHTSLRPVASVTAWGLVVATLISSKVDVLRPIGAFFGGGGSNVQYARELELEGSR